MDYGKNSRSTYLAITDLAGNYTYVSPFFTEVFDLKIEDIYGTSSLDTIYFEDHQKCIETVEKCFKEPMILHKVILRKPVNTEKVIWTEWEFMLNLDENGAPKEMVCYGHNITELVEHRNLLEKIEKEAADRQTKYATLFDTASLGIVLHTSDGSIIEANETFCKMVNVTTQDISSHNFLEFVKKEDHQHFHKGIKKQIINPSNNFFERDLITIDGTELPISVNQRIFHDGLGNVFVWTIVKDNTERKKQRQELEHQKELLEQTAKIAKLGGWELDVKTLKAEWTSEVYTIYDLEDDSAVNVENAISYYHPDDQVIITAAVNKAIQNGETYELELRIISAKGNEKWVLTSGAPVYSNGKITSIKGVIQDITEQKTSESIILRQNELLKDAYFAQSHLVRLPIANIIGLINLIDITQDETERYDIYLKIKQSVQQLDSIIKDVAQKKL